VGGTPGSPPSGRSNDGVEPSGGRDERLAVLWSRVAAGLVPALLSALWVAWLLQRPAVEVTSASEAALELDQVLDERELDVLIVGNSAAKRNIDPRQLGRALDRQVLDLGLPGTLAPTWYVVLRDRIYARGLQPAVVVVADTPPGMLALQPSSPRMHAKMMELASGLDPIEERRAYGGAAGGALSRIATRSSVVRSALVDGLRNTATGLVFTPYGRGSLHDRGRDRADAAVQAVLGEGGTVAAGLEGAMSPVVRRLRPDELALVQGHAADSFLGATVDLVRANGGEVVYVHLPRRNGALDPGAFEGRAEIVAFLNERGVPYVDLSREHTDAALFMDNNHMATAGKEALTDTLAEALRGVLGGEGFTPTVVPGEQVRVERIGAPPPPQIELTPGSDPCTWTASVPAALTGPSLAAMRVHTPPFLVLQDGEPLRRAESDEGGCSGTFTPTLEPLVVHPTSPDVGPARLAVVLDPAVPLVAPLELTALARVGAGATVPGGVAGYWVYPGTTLRFAFPEGWTFDDGVLSSSVLVVDPGAAEATLTVAGRAVPIEASGRVLRAGPVTVQADGAWVAEWSSPEGGPWLLVRDVRVGPHAAPIHVIGSPATSAVTASFLPSGVTDATVTFASEPPEIVSGPVGVSAGKGQIAVQDGPLLTMRAANRTAGKKACSPVVVELDGRLIDAHPGNGAVQFELPRGADRSLARAVLHPDRRCTWWPAARGGGSKGAGPLFMAPLRTARWVYPGDAVTFSRPDLVELHGLGAVLVLEGFRFGSEVDLVATVRAGGAEQRLVVSVAPGAIDAALPLEVPLDPRAAGEVSVTLQADDPDDAGFVYVTALHLAESP
jgi:hypothetical protein